MEENWRWRKDRLYWYHYNFSQDRGYGLKKDFYIKVYLISNFSMALLIFMMQKSLFKKNDKNKTRST